MEANFKVCGPVQPLPLDIFSLLCTTPARQLCSCEIDQQVALLLPLSASEGNKEGLVDKREVDRFGDGPSPPPGSVLAPSTWGKRQNSQDPCPTEPVSGAGECGCQADP
jgi:hypothetical protein